MLNLDRIRDKKGFGDLVPTGYHTLSILCCGAIYNNIAKSF